MFAATFAGLLAATAMFYEAACAAEKGSDDQIELYRDALAAEIAPRARAVLDRIEGTPRQLLALRSYVRMRKRVEERWSWTQEQIEAFSKTLEYRKLIQEVEGVQARFEADNPGYTLYANTEVRSLDVQLERWNENRTVSDVAESIQRAVRKELVKSDYPAQPDDAAVERFRDFLRHWWPRRAAPLAAPGLSLHGQLRAIDFAVLKDGKIVAPTNLVAAETVWQKDGWSEKLKRATAGTAFAGPLQVPNEPWHYEYIGRKRETRIAGE
jgi:hypothetical protein